jgi:hypothetical protein
VASVFSSPMAAAFGFATSIATSTQSNPNLLPSTLSCPQLQTFYKPLNNRRASALNQSLRVRCESVTQNLNSIDKEELKRSSVMALAQLKASAIDGEFALFYFDYLKLDNVCASFYYVVQKGCFFSFAHIILYFR